MSRRNNRASSPIAAALIAAVAVSRHHTSLAFTATTVPRAAVREAQHSQLSLSASIDDNDVPLIRQATKFMTSVAATAALSASLFLNVGAAHAENELSDIYGGKGFDSSLVDQTCLVDKCSLQAKACLADDPSCRKGLTCTAKCLGDNACITGCMARYGDKNLDNLLKCTIEDHECIKVAILDGGADKFGEEPRPPAPTVRNFDIASMEGSWYKVVGYNPNYDCYACQRNTFSAPEGGNALGIGNDRLQVDVEFSMPHMMPDGTPPPPENKRESVKKSDVDGFVYGSQSIGFNDYSTHETMVFDNARDSSSKFSNLVLGKGTGNEQTYSRTAHSEGEMFGLKFWENWYIIGENDPGQAEFKFIYYNGKTRQNTYDGAFVYSKTRELTPEAMQKVYQIAADAGMNPDQFCKIRNGCFRDEAPAKDIGTPANPFRGIMASTKISQLLGVESVAAEPVLRETAPPKVLMPPEQAAKRAWWYEVGDYLEDPHRHFRAMDSLRQTMDWPDFVKSPTGLQDK
uniref:VDE lipocalin domain-containing protein n=1 Tax=Helicotheca tamesis TaxID=374047 RepID=A0A7S2IA10_9STRA|mmetsp:Transcript_7126/g.9647  ORF Transcript_7126/g.9647 Transcript_7126/m.9647 type:complete len:516 (+) Transcript_7126:141-1688(+)|eukprot:CAMPEP_0185729748 /NCGR_PEP_ID=MMETSP1171-20130828/7044_1 /TAXON_ID=374046 /ORGANISM="Helicotheca tamensis, Strain CCMP826" /LENGTH=515 /DNA_ID=CAMNT_0028398657 /DNA_START=85 /DNA_END=1632 /DNA_ORIENTATION=+